LATTFEVIRPCVRIERDSLRQKLAIRDARIIGGDDLDVWREREKKSEDHRIRSRKRAAAFRNSSDHSWPPSKTQVSTSVKNFKSFFSFSSVYQSSRRPLPIRTGGMFEVTSGGTSAARTMSPAARPKSLAA